MAFVIWERTREAASAALARALAAGVVKRGDPVIMGTIAHPAPLPVMRWTGATSMSEAELIAIAEMQPHGATGADPKRLSDRELSNTILEAAARPA